MYCTKCGKEIESGSICSTCAAQPQVPPRPQVMDQPPQYQQPPINQQPPQYQQNYSQYSYPGNVPPAPQPPRYSNQPEPYNRMYGFGKALTSTILSNIGFIIAYLAFCVAALVLSGEAPAEAGFVFFVIGLPLTIIPMILGISSINTFKKRKAPCVKPIATLVLGIVGLATSAFGLLFELFAFLVLMTF